MSLEKPVSAKHPLRAVRVLADASLQSMNVALAAMESHTGRPSIPPERLIRARRLQIFYLFRSERLLMEQFDHNLLLRWFVGLEVDGAGWDASTFAKNRERWVDLDVGKHLLNAVVKQTSKKGWVSDAHFSVDGRLADCGMSQGYAAAWPNAIQAWASMTRVRLKDDPESPNSGGGSNVEVDLHGQGRSNDTPESKTDPECRLHKKAEGPASKLAYLGHALIENRSGLAIDGCVRRATGTAERDAAFERVDGVRAVIGFAYNQSRSGLRSLRGVYGRALQEREFSDTVLTPGLAFCKLPLRSPEVIRCWQPG